MSSLPPVPTALLLSFFEKATKELVSLSWDDRSVSSSNSSMTLSEFRILILKTQQSALNSVVHDYQTGASASTKENKESDEFVTIEQVQKQLQTMDTHVDFSTHLEGPLRNMTMAARQALARLVLQQELKNHQQHQQPHPTKSSSPPLTRTAVLDFCGLCQAAVQLDAVQEFLSCRLSSPIRDDHPTLRLYDTKIVGKFIFPHERMQYIQKLYFAALGYHAETANQQLQGLIEGDTELEQIFTDTIHQLRQALAVATMHMQQEELNDFEQGGVTRVVSVKHSDSNNHDIMPQTIGMVRSDPENHDNTTTHRDDGDIDDDVTVVRMARDTAALEQTLLAQLLQMDSDERTAVLEQAQVAHDELMTTLANLTTPSERVAYMTSSTALSKETRKLLLLHQIWQGLLDRNGGQLPKMASTRDRDY